LTRFGSWLLQIARGDLGNSIFTTLPVFTTIVQRIEPTLSLMVLTLIVAVVVAVPLGVLAAWKNGSVFDRAVMAFAVVGFSVPAFTIGYILAFVFALTLGWLPVQGYTPISQGVGPWLRTLALPTATVSLVYIALIIRVTRASMLEILTQDYLRTARAKGLGEG